MRNLLSDKIYTLEEYMELEERAEHKHEYIAGKIRPMMIASDFDEEELARCDICKNMNDVNDRKSAKGFLRRTLSLIPNFLRLLYGLMRDPRVPMMEKALLAGAIAYVLSPLDFIPDLLPFIGQFDDLYLIALVTLRLMAHTSDDVIRDNWHGDQDITSVIDKIVTASTYVLPKRMREVLIGKIQFLPRKNLSQK